MAALAHNPLVATQIALVSNAADTVEQHYAPTSPDAEQLPKLKRMMGHTCVRNASADRASFRDPPLLL